MKKTGMINCKKCRGDGYEEVKKFVNGTMARDQQKCTRCQGNGFVEEVVKASSGRKQKKKNNE